jgi:hypothetical protein
MLLMVGTTLIVGAVLGTALVRRRSVREVCFDALAVVIERLYTCVLMLKLFLLLRRAESRKWGDAHELADDAAADVGSGAAWARFCDGLKEAGEVVLRDGPGGRNVSALDAAEGLRYLSRLTRGGLECFVENADARFPRLVGLPDLVKLGADNPDNFYQTASVSGAHQYRIWGTRGTTKYLSFAVVCGNYPGKAAKGNAEAGEEGTTSAQYGLEDYNLVTSSAANGGMGEDGEATLEIILSVAQPEGAAGKTKTKNWLRMDLDSERLIVRQSFSDRSGEKAACLFIERIADGQSVGGGSRGSSSRGGGGGGSSVMVPDEGNGKGGLYGCDAFVRANSDVAARIAADGGDVAAAAATTSLGPAPLTATEISAGLSGALVFVHGAANQFAGWSRAFAEAGENTLVMHGFANNKMAWADPNIKIHHGYWRLAEGQALLVEFEAPTEGEYWNFQLNNWWMESLDYRRHPVTVNNHTARHHGGGGGGGGGAKRRVRIVIAPASAWKGAPPPDNWIDTACHEHGTMALRWVRVGPKGPPQPWVRVASIAELV